MMNLLNFNDSSKYACKYEGAIPLVRSGTVQTTSLQSFCNALLLSCSKKFILEDDNDKITSIDKLNTDFKTIYRESQVFTDFFNDVDSKMINLLEELYKFITQGTTNGDDEPLLRQLLTIIFNDSDSDDSHRKKIECFITIINSIISVDDFKKIIKLQKRGGGSESSSLDEMKTHLLKDIKQFMKFKDLDDSEKSRFIKLNALLLVDSIFDIVIQSLTIPEFNPTKTSHLLYQIAAKHFQINLFILHATTEDIVFNTEYNPNLKSVILLKFEDCYEVIGKLRQGNIINRQFFPYEDVVQSIIYHLRSPKSDYMM